MAATGWSYFAPFQDDVQKVLDELKETVFAEGRFVHPGSFDADQNEQSSADLKSLYEKLPPGEDRDRALRFLEFARDAENWLCEAKSCRPRRTSRRCFASVANQAHIRSLTSTEYP